jgi:NAD(P)-dependent dehydrogenase (short-subunit alcohol dehydrogenase family)
VLVTGGNSGIGFECARHLARAGWHVLIAGRNRDASAAAVERIARESGDGAAAEVGLDLASVDSVRQLAREIDARRLRLRALVCNAGLQLGREPQRSSDGFEMTFAANHLGHFLLANLLLVRLLANAPARVVVVSSGVHDPRLRTGMPKPNVADPASLAAPGGPQPGDFDGRLAYVHSKLCNLWFAYELGRRLAAAGLSDGARRLTVNAFDPGLVPGSGLARDYPPVLRFAWNRILPPLARVLSRVVPTVNPPWKAGQALAGLVLDPALAGVSGKYFPSHARWREAPSSDASYDPAMARALWEASVRMTRLTREESPLAA